MEDKNCGENRLEARLLGIVRNRLSESAEVKRRLAVESASFIADAGRRLAGVVAGGHKILLCGNGGSAADCQHIAAELTNRLGVDDERPGIAAIALTTDTSFLTARANDYGFDDVYARLVGALGCEGDALVAITTSGTSRNVVNAVKRAREKAMLTIGLLGGNGGELASVVDVAIIVPSDSTQYIQESHIAIGHILCEILLGCL